MGKLEVRRTMKKALNLMSWVVISALLSLSGYANAATVSLDALTGDTESLFLTAGTYEVTHVNQDPLAWNAWGTVVCQNNVCSKGFLNQYTIIIDGVSTLVADGIRYASAQAAFENAAPFTFSIAVDQSVEFLITDSNYRDNTGGLTLNVSAVPLPAAAWLFLSAIGGLAGVKRIRRLKVAPLSA